jgi:hypothetical protein
MQAKLEPNNGKINMDKEEKERKIKSFKANK